MSLTPPRDEKETLRRLSVRLSKIEEENLLMRTDVVGAIRDRFRAEEEKRSCLVSELAGKCAEAEECRLKFEVDAKLFLKEMEIAYKVNLVESKKHLEESLRSDLRSSGHVGGGGFGGGGGSAVSSLPVQHAITDLRSKLLALQSKVQKMSSSLTSSPSSPIAIAKLEDRVEGIMKREQQERREILGSLASQSRNMAQLLTLEEQAREEHESSVEQTLDGFRNTLQTFQKSIKERPEVKLVDRQIKVIEGIREHVVQLQDEISNIDPSSIQCVQDEVGDVIERLRVLEDKQSDEERLTDLEEKIESLREMQTRIANGSKKFEEYAQERDKNLEEMQKSLRTFAEGNSKSKAAGQTCASCEKCEKRVSEMQETMEKFMDRLNLVEKARDEEKNHSSVREEGEKELKSDITSLSSRLDELDESFSKVSRENLEKQNSIEESAKEGFDSLEERMVRLQASWTDQMGALKEELASKEMRISKQIQEGEGKMNTELAEAIEEFSKNTYFLKTSLSELEGKLSVMDVSFSHEKEKGEDQHIIEGRMIDVESRQGILEEVMKTLSDDIQEMYDADAGRKSWMEHHEETHQGIDEDLSSVEEAHARVQTVGEKLDEGLRDMSAMKSSIEEFREEISQLQRLLSANPDHSAVRSSEDLIGILQDISHRDELSLSKLGELEDTSMKAVQVSSELQSLVSGVDFRVVELGTKVENVEEQVADMRLQMWYPRRHPDDAIDTLLVRTLRSLRLPFHLGFQLVESGLYKSGTNGDVVVRLDETSSLDGEHPDHVLIVHVAEKDPIPLEQFLNEEWSVHFKRNGCQFIDVPHVEIDSSTFAEEKEE
jgi:chromosome segregation ATPase